MDKNGAGLPPAVAERHERDPEREWKSHPQPWAGAGWARASGPAGEGGGIRPGEGRPPFWKGFARGLLVRTMAAAALFAAARFLFASGEPWALAGQSAVRQAITQQMDFAAAGKWYRTLFAGTPSFIPLFAQDEARRANAGTAPAAVMLAPVREGVIVRAYPKLGSGVEIAPPGGGDGAVTAAERGRVTLVTRDAKGITVVLRHAAGLTTIYGQLAEAAVRASDWVEAGERIGTLPSAGSTAPGHLYYAVKENGRYVDPADRLPHD